MSEIDILNQFKTSIISFLDELIEQFPQEPDLIIFRIFIKDQAQIVNVINYFIHKLLPLKDMISKRDENFFLNHCTLFDSVKEQGKKESINHFKKLWRSSSLDEEDKIVMWKWFDSFVYLAEKYQKILIKNIQK